VLAEEKVVPVSYTEDTRRFTHIDKSDTCLVGDRGKNKIYVKGKVGCHDQRNFVAVNLTQE
jgi:hypothetical protein